MTRKDVIGNDQRIKDSRYDEWHDKREANMSQVTVLEKAMRAQR